jgi:hypothetical protein
MPAIVFSGACIASDINATVFLDFSNVVVFIVEQALRRFDTMIP